MNNLGKNIRRLRVENNLTQQQLADKVGVTQKAISFWEDNINEPKALYLINLANCFNVSADYLLGLENEEGVKLYEENFVKISEIEKLYNKLTIKEKDKVKGYIDALLANRID